MYLTTARLGEYNIYIRVYLKRVIIYLYHSILYLCSGRRRQKLQIKHHTAMVFGSRKTKIV